MIKFFSILLTVVFSQFLVKAQTDEEAVKLVITKMFYAMKSADGVQLKSCFADSMILQTIVPDKSAGVKVKTESASEFAEFISKTKAGDADEQITFETIKIDGPLAVIWTPYKFFYKGKFNHCGVNSFHLVKDNKGWKIQYLIDTRRTTSCGQ